MKGVSISPDDHILNKYPEDMRKEIVKLAAEYTYSIVDIERYYLMGGYNHAKKLLDLKLKCGYDDRQIQVISNVILEDNFKKSISELRKIDVKKDGFIKKVVNKIKYIWYRIQSNFYYEMKESLVDQKSEKYKKYENKYEDMLERLMK